jgi:hypothetical protein
VTIVPAQEVVLFQQWRDRTAPRTILEIYAIENDALQIWVHVNGERHHTEEGFATALAMIAHGIWEPIA